MKESFIKYLEEHPEQRFWQALRNWTRENVDADCDSILIASQGFDDLDGPTINNLKDTFYYEDDRVRKE